MAGKMDFNIDTIKKQIKQQNLKNVDIEGARESFSILQFDKKFTFNMFENINPDSYYDVLSCDTHLSDIKSPMLFINSKTDPISKY